MTVKHLVSDSKAPGQHWHSMLMIILINNKTQTCFLSFFYLPVHIMNAMNTRDSITTTSGESASCEGDVVMNLSVSVWPHSICDC
jgi:hypothetical protein